MEACRTPQQTDVSTPQSDAREGHLHFDRVARVWRTTAEETLGVVRIQARRPA